MENRYRYRKAFVIATLFYTISIASFLYTSSNTQVSKSSSQHTQTSDKVHIAIVRPKPVCDCPPEPKVEPKKIEKKPEPKPEPKKISKTKVEKKIVKEKIVKKIEPKHLPQPKPIVSQKNTTVKATKAKNDVNSKVIAQQQNEYFALIKSTINKNKSYPYRALKRGIEDEVKVKFTISKDGNLLNVEVLNSKTLFKQHTIDAIVQSFPIKPPKDIFIENTTLNLTISYKIN